MVKWKKMNKKMAGLLLGVMMLFTASTTAFAYVDESAEASKVETIQTEQSTDKEEKKDHVFEKADRFTERQKEKEAQVAKTEKVGKEQPDQKPKTKKHDMEL